MSNLSELLPAGAGAKSADFVASGTLGSGVTVALKSDGTVEAISAVVEGAGTPVVFENGSTADISATYDSTNNKIVIAYKDTGNLEYGTAVVGTVSGTAISFGTAVVFNGAQTEEIKATYDSANNKIVIAYRDRGNSNYGTAIVGTVSGTSISFGTEVVFASVNAYPGSATYDSNAGKVVIAYGNASSSYYGTAIVGTVSGTSISFGTAVVFESAGTYDISATYDSNSNKVVIAYKDAGNSDFGTAIVGTVSGTSISFGTAAVFASAITSSTSTTYDSANEKIVIAYTDNDNSYYGTAIVGTVSGTSISFGTEVVFNSADTYSLSATYDVNAGKIVTAYRNSANSNYGTVVVGTVSGTSIIFGSPIVFESAASNEIATTYDSANSKVVIAYQDGGNGSRGTSVVFTVGTTNSADFIGITDQAIADTATGAVIVQGGVSEKLSGLTVGADYYVQDDGSLGSPTASIPYDISGASYDSVSFSVSGQVTDPTDLSFNTDGTKLYITDPVNNRIYQYSLSTGYDISTASYDSVSFSFASQDGAMYGTRFNNDGTKLFGIGVTTDSLYQYSLSGAFSIATLSYDSVSFSVAAQDTAPISFTFNDDGTKIYVVGTTTDTVYQYSLSSAFDLSTASYDSVSFSFTGQDSNIQGAIFNPTGTALFLTGIGSDNVYEYSLSTPFDLSTISYTGNSLSVASQDTSPNEIAFNADGSKMFMVGSITDAVYQYSTGVGSVTSVPAGRALSSTSILLEG